MFEDSGKKLQTWASILFVIAVFGFIVYGIVEIVSIAKSGYQLGVQIPIQLGIVAVGIVGARISALMMYTIGKTNELVEQQMMDLNWEIKKNKEAQEQIEQKIEQFLKDEKAYHSKEPDSTVTFCPVCHTANANTDTFCRKCGQSLRANKSADTPAPSIPVPEQTIPVFKNVCPKCGKNNPEEYLFCQYCGEKLV